MKILTFTSFILTSILMFSSCTSTSEKNSENEQLEETSINYVQLGDSLSNLAQQALLMEVSNHIQSEGVISTLKYCNIHALPLLDSVSEIHQVNISRISAKNRNPNNKASEEELAILEYLSNQKNDTIIESGNKIVYYKTIKLGMPACIKCHGIPEKDISSDAVRIIDSLYPKDQAKNYSLGEFRGAWKIEFKKD